MRIETDLPASNPDTDLDQTFGPKISKVSNTSLSILINENGVTGTVSQYKVIYRKMTADLQYDGAGQQVLSNSNPIVLSGLEGGKTYEIKTQILSASANGNIKTVLYHLVGPATTVSKIGAPKPIGEKIVAKSYLKLEGGTSADSEYTYAYKNFDSITLPTSTTVTLATRYSAKSYSAQRYAFGTMFMMPSLVVGYEAQGAGFGFFVDPEKGSGYFISIDSTGTSASLKTNPVNIFKLENKNMKKLADSQSGNRETLDGIFGGRTYNLDIKVKIEGLKVTITVYINGFKITATDETSILGANVILEPTKNVALLAVSGVSMFDYVYAKTIDETEYLKDNVSNFYRGQFSKDFLSSSYGDMYYYASTEDTGNTSIETLKQSFEEFGTVVREIGRKQVKFSSRPAVPISWTTGANQLAQVISQSFDNFKSEVFVLNNSSITIPLSDRGVNQLSIFGYTIGFSGDIEYVTDPVSEFASKEPVIFESQWLHFEKDVKSLAEWIKGKIVNKSKVISMSVFGNPLISVGDIITVDYEYQGFTEEQRIIVIKVSQSFDNGITTKITGRTI